MRPEYKELLAEVEADRAEYPVSYEPGRAWHREGLLATAVRDLDARAEAAEAERDRRDTDLQDRITAWHCARFPDAGAEHVALKMAEECGEVASALNALVGRNSATGRGNVPEEAADVVIVAMVLIGRWFPGIDLLAKVEQKLAILTDPASGHPASLARAARAAPEGTAR